MGQARRGAALTATRTTGTGAAPAALAAGILAVSTGAIFVRLAQHDVPSLTIAACRLGLATIVLAPFVLLRHRTALRSLAARDVALVIVSGVCLAVHFATWILSLETTSVVSSVVLVSTAPLWVALLAPLVLRERLAAAGWIGIAIALAGGTIVAMSDAPHAGAHGHAVRGDLLSLAGAWAMAAYLIAGRRLRARLALAPYVFAVYGVAAVVLAAAALGAGQRLSGIPAGSWRWLVLLALVPQLLGHSTLNWALRWLPAPLVAIALLGEPVGSGAMAWVVLGEPPGLMRAVGAVLILAGIVWAARATPGEAAAS